MIANKGKLTVLRRCLTTLILALAGLAMALSPQSASPQPAPSAHGEAYILELDGAIGPASASYITDGLERAREEGAQLIIITVDTPGGLDTSMREIIQAILAMPVPVAAYVHPSGARAASAGTFILYASHFAAMTPGTNLGAATPIQIGGSGEQPQGNDEEEDGQASMSAGERKATNDAVAYIRSLAEMHGRNADWAELAVREAASLSAEAALEQNVIDIVARDTRSLLEQLDGMSAIVNGQEHALSTAGMTLTEIEPDWTTKLLAIVTNPNVALIMTMIGVYGLLLEFMNPGAMVPGTIGAISLLIGLYGLAVLPVDFAGVALMILGIALMVGEAFAPSFGILGLGGLAAFVFGSTILIDTDVPEFRISWSVIAAVGVFSAVLIIAIARVGLKSFGKSIQTGSEELIGAPAEVLDWKDGKGHVFLHSERWNATGPRSLPVGASVIVEGIRGLQLNVSLNDKTEEKNG